MTQSTEQRRVPADSFRIRLAIVRAEMGWNYDQAETATGISSENWRLWEKGRRCTDVIGVSRRIAAVTDYDQTWLALGGPLAVEDQTPPPARRTVTSIQRVKKQSSRECLSSTRRTAIGSVRLFHRTAA